MEQTFDVTDTMAGELPVVAVSGEIDLATAPVLRAHLDAHLEAGRSTILVDLELTTFLDSTGLGVLVSVLKRCREADGELRLVIPEPRILKLFTITGLHETFAILPTVEAALHAGGVEGAS